mmetsp:Transcript_2438/g.6010  ORF Transcript_2438/g.6010 Transcript_2438/m.6010 type:complete len:387 (+) Transcript_2438:436-1596(+)
MPSSRMLCANSARLCSAPWRVATSPPKVARVAISASASEMDEACTSSVSMSILSSTQRCSASDCLAYSTRISSSRIWRASSTSSPSLYSLPASLSSSMVSLMFWTRVCRENWRKGGQPASTAWLTRSVSLPTPPSRPLSSSSYAANMLSLACTLAAESSPPSGASAVFSASATSASIFVEPLPVNDLPRVKAFSCLSSLTSSDTKAAAEPGTITPLSPGSSMASAVTVDAFLTRFLLEPPPPPKKLPTLSSIVPPTLFLRSRPAEEARVLRRGGGLSPAAMPTDMPPAAPAVAWVGPVGGGAQVTPPPVVGGGRTHGTLEERRIAVEMRGAASPSATETRRIFWRTCSHAILVAIHSSCLVARELKILMSSSIFLSAFSRAFSLSS